MYDLKAVGSPTSNLWFKRMIQMYDPKAVGSPASNLHNLDLEADLQRQPVTFFSSFIFFFYCTILTFIISSWHRPLHELPESKTWDHFQTYHSRWGHAPFLLKTFLLKTFCSKLFCSKLGTTLGHITTGEGTSLLNLFFVEQKIFCRNLHCEQQCRQDWLETSSRTQSWLRQRYRGAPLDNGSSLFQVKDLCRRVNLGEDQKEKLRLALMTKVWKAIKSASNWMKT